MYTHAVLAIHILPLLLQLLQLAHQVFDIRVCYLVVLFCGDTGRFCDMLCLRARLRLWVRGFGGNAFAVRRREVEASKDMRNREILRRPKYESAREYCVRELGPWSCRRSLTEGALESSDSADCGGTRKHCRCSVD